MAEDCWHERKPSSYWGFTWFKVKPRQGNMSSGSQVVGTEAARCCLQLLMGAGTGTAAAPTVWAWRLGREARVRVVSWAVSTQVCWMASEERSHLPALVIFRYVPHKPLHHLSLCPASLSQLLQAWSGIWKASGWNRLCSCFFSAHPGSELKQLCTTASASWDDWTEEVGLSPL